ncbi:formate dehydrogenase accessory sulfurtransferase FdhD [Calidifontibacter sp. DB0510]|uniref:Sulfur carrier protein FdhD n=1 Tax=Metallococcus carri TaxID=1656884 RepID=A0A967E901_9MICO|nr:formate dehydrogenase accessory sulfurtransferase FdhD [Metallococcus carri]NHN54705.1 formate dehydrogenase accessory sulfurtransferase FdhD [Metallococcus carri]NOP37050.1 formate dehydrogenase accessory sulfurtransferase FdhD [Calidifontibacter sp. DB2511S]
MGRRIHRRRLTAVRFDDHGQATTHTRAEDLAVEEPLEVRVGGETLTVTMRLPGDDIELVHGLLLGEGLITCREDVLLARYCADTETLNVLEVTLREGERPMPVNAHRTLVMHGGCGLCGKASIDAVQAAGPQVDSAHLPTLDARTLASLPEQLRAQQKAFDRTGGTHAAGLFTANGEPLVVREDIGRHNAVDKVIGWSLLQGVNRVNLTLTVSSRASFDIVQKAAMAGIGTVVTVSAPSALAVQAADDLGITLAAFARGDRVTLCSHEGRVTLGA